MVDYLRLQWRRWRTMTKFAGLGLALAMLGWALLAWGMGDAANYCASAPSAVNASGTNRSDQVVIRWGEPEGTAGDEYLVTNAPAWWWGAIKDGGEWTIAPPLWYVPEDAPEGMGSLMLWLRRATLSNDIRLITAFYDQAGAALFVDLLSTNGTALATNLIGNLMLGSNEWVRVEMEVPLIEYPEAAVIRLRRGTGDVAVCESVVTLAHEETGVTTADAAPAGERKEVVYRAELAAGTLSALGQPAAACTGGAESPQERMIYVNGTTGDDGNDGLTAAVAAVGQGPKKTVGAGLGLARAGDTVLVAGGVYYEDVNPPAGVTFRVAGCVEFKSRPVE